VQKKLAENPAGPLWLFGLGSPLLLDEFSAEGRTVSVLEPRLEVIRKTLELYDFSGRIEAQTLLFRTLADLAGRPAPEKAGLLIHPPSGRARPEALIRLANYLALRDQKILPSASPRILFIGPLSGGTETFGPPLLKAARQLGLPAELLAWPEELYCLSRAVRRDSTRDAGPLFRLAASEVQKALRAFRPDLGFVLAQAPLTARSLEQLSQESECLWAFWFAEDAGIFRYAEETAPAYDLFFHIQGSLLDAEIRSWGLPRAWYLPPAADPDFFRPRPKIPPEFQSRISLMGAGYPNRRVILEGLISRWLPQSGLKPGDFKIFGSGWDGWPEPFFQFLFEKGRRVTAEECALIYAGTQVNLNIHSSVTNGFNPQSAFVNPRTFELAAAGAFQLTDSRPLLRELFTGEEVVSVSEPAELPEKIEYYLARPELREEIGRAARARVLAEHQYIHRLGRVIQCARMPAF
jgi:spore maturation protein CgeB